MALDRPPAVSKLGKYELLREQAGSGVGSTWIARSTEDAEGSTQLYTVLRLHRHLMKKADAAEAFLSEVRQAQHFKHPNAVSLVDLGSNDGEVFVATEHVEGELLSSLITGAGSEGLPPPV